MHKHNQDKNVTFYLKHNKQRLRQNKHNKEII